VCVCVYASYSVKSTNFHVMVQDEQCTYNVTLRRIRVTIVGVEKQVVHILCVCL